MQRRHPAGFFLSKLRETKMAAQSRRYKAFEKETAQLVASRAGNAYRPAKFQLTTSVTVALDVDAPDVPVTVIV